MQLTEQHRQKLDSIVAQMEANGETEEDIRFVVEDFKQKYAGAPVQGRDYAAEHAANLAQSDPTFGQALGQFGRGVVEGAVELPGKLWETARGLNQMANEEIARSPMAGPMVALGKAGLALAQGIPAYVGEAAGRLIYGSPEDVGRLVGENVAPFAAAKGLKVAGAGAKLAGKGIGRVVGSPEEIYQSALKPSTTFSLEKRARILKTGIEERIPVNRKGLTKARNVIEDIKSQVDAKLQEAQAAGAPEIPTAAIAQRIEDVKPRFMTVNPDADIAALDALKESFTKYGETIPITEAQKLKINTYRKLKEKAYGEQKTATTEGEKALARGLKEELEKIVPELGALNAREGSVIALEKALTRAVARINNHQLFGIGTPAMGALGYAVGGAPGAAALAMLKLVLDNPTVKSRLSFALSRARSVTKSLDKGGASVNTLGRGPTNEPPTSTPNIPTAPSGPGANPETGAGNQAVGEGSLRPSLQTRRGSVRQVDPIKEEALSLINSFAQQYGGKGGIPVKTRATVYKEYQQSPSGVLEGVGGGARRYEGMNIDDIPVLNKVHDVHTKSAIENALVTRRGKVWQRIVAEAEDYVRKYKEEEQLAKELGDEVPF